MNKRVSVSVIIPVYNVKNYLIDCLDSVAAQHFLSKEVILVDDGSTDGSGDICDVYAAKYTDFRVIHKPNGGLSSARNRGIDEARGQWLIFLDSDDLWSNPDCLQKLHSYAEKLDLDVVRFEHQAVNEKLEYIEPRNYEKSNIVGRVIDNYELVNFGISGEWFAVLYLLRKETIGDLRFNEQTKFQEDIDFTVGFLLLTNCVAATLMSVCTFIVKEQPQSLPRHESVIWKVRFHSAMCSITKALKSTIKG